MRQCQHQLKSSYQKQILPQSAALKEGTECGGNFFRYFQRERLSGRGRERQQLECSLVSGAGERDRLRGMVKVTIAIETATQSYLGRRIDNPFFLSLI
jgi:hypothetical protein